MKATILAVALALTLLVAACTTTTTAGDSMMTKDEEFMMEKTDGSMMEDEEAMTVDGEGGDHVAVKDEGAMMESSYMGMTLAGKTTPYLEFSQEDYEKALSEGKLIILYFYADWCPTCKAEQPDVFAAFDRLDDPDVVGFRVNYKDGETDDYEESLARQFGISYQHTKVFVKDGKQLLKSPESWDEGRYLSEVAKYS